MKLPDATIKHLGRILRERADAATKRPLPARLLFLLGELGTARIEARAALHRVWARNTRRSADQPRASTRDQSPPKRHASRSS